LNTHQRKSRSSESRTGSGTTAIDSAKLQYERVPVRIFVVWHPCFAEGKEVFKKLYEWLGGPRRELYRRGLGVPVQAWTTTTNDIPPGDIPLEHQELTIVVPILDGEFLGRKAWRDWINQFDSKSELEKKSITVLPWGVHQAAVLTPGIRALNLLGSGQCDAEQLCRRVTEACVVRMHDPDELKPISVFISYARQDGPDIARDVRNALQNYGRLTGFLDEHDLAPGSNWREELNSKLTAGVGMFAVVTDAYASRAWCREELRNFRTPQQDSDCWYLRPLFILDNLSGERTRSMFEVGSAPAARWNPDKANNMVDDLIREMLFAQVNGTAARQMASREREIVKRRAQTASHDSAGSGEPPTQFINWVPDTWTLLQILRLQPKPGPLRIAYPGDGLPKVELERLAAVFPGLTLVSFEELRRGDLRLVPETTGEARQKRPPVLLSVSTPSEQDLACRGMQPVHLDDVAIRIARALLLADLDVMYGGMPRVGFTDGFQDDSGAIVLDTRFINYLSWPYTLDLTANDVANNFGVTRYVSIPWPGEKTAVRSDVWAAAEAATHARRKVVSQALHDVDGAEVGPPLALIALGGRTDGFAGFLPGVAEEIAMALRAGIAVYILGGFGGAAEQMVAALSGKRPTTLTLGHFTKFEKYRQLRKAATTRARKNQLRRHLDRLWKQVKRSNLRNGLDKDENAALWSTTDVGLAVTLLSKGLKEVYLRENYRPPGNPLPMTGARTKRPRRTLNGDRPPAGA
jgi:SLOG cluster2/TIR domain